MAESTKEINHKQQQMNQLNQPYNGVFTPQKQPQGFGVII